MKSLIISLYIVLMLTSTDVLSIKLAPMKADEQLVIEISEIGYPLKILTRELNSGLPCTISTKITIQKQDKELAVYHQMITVVYDLWDEIYKAEIVDMDNVRRETFKDLPTVMAFLGLIRIQQDFAHLKNIGQVSFAVNIVLNPIGRDKVVKIRKWIAERNGYTADLEGEQAVKYKAHPSGSVGVGEDNLVSPALGGNHEAQYSKITFKKLFDKIFEQYVESEGDVGVWSTHFKSPLFKLENIGHESISN